MANANNFSVEAFIRLPMQQKLLAIVVLAITLSIAVSAWNWSRTPSYAVLFTNVSERDGGAVINALQQMNVPYQFNESGGSILVPQNQVHEMRLRLASQGLPKGGIVGFELMETQKIGLSQFLEQINFQRALEGELSRSIQSLSAVQGARVHLAIPKQTAFLRDEEKPSASVLLNIHPGRTLEPNQVGGIMHLVAASVPHLPAANVSVIDQNGNLLSSEKDASRGMGLDATQLKYVQEVESSYVKRIDNILAAIVGSGNFRAQVTADVDFSQAEQVAETYKPNPNPDTSIRSQQISEAGGGASGGASGVPGALSNQPPVPATAPLTTPAVPGSTGTGSGAAGATTVANTGTGAIGANGRRDSTINYELDKTIRHVRQSAGNIKRLSVAVVVNNKKDAAKPAGKALSEKELTQITNLVKEAMGFNKERGDTLNVANSPFAIGDKEAIDASPFWKNPTLIGWLLEGLKYLVFAGVAGYLFFGIVKPFLKKLMDRATTVPAAQSEGAGMPINYEQKVGLAREMARNEPQVVANVIKEWVSSGQ